MFFENQKHLDNDVPPSSFTSQKGPGMQKEHQVLNGFNPISWGFIENCFHVMVPYGLLPSLPELFKDVQEPLARDS